MGTMIHKVHIFSQIVGRIDIYKVQFACSVWNHYSVLDGENSTYGLTDNYCVRSNWI